MRRVFCAVGVVAVVMILAGRGALIAQQPSGTALDIGGAAPGSALEIALNGGKIADATADERGETTSVLDLSNLGKVRVSVYVDRCEDGRIVKVQLVSDGNAAPPVDEGCDRKPAGVFWSDSGRIVLDVNGATVSTPGGIPRNVLIGGGAAAAALGVALAAGGDSESGTTPTPGGSSGTPAFNPSGTFQVTTMTKLDPGEHGSFIRLGSSGTLAVTANSPIQFGGTGLQNWVAVSGDFDAATGRFSATGRGTVAGFSNVGVKFEGTITTSGALNGDYTMGTGGELPGGQAIVYGVTGQRQ